MAAEAAGSAERVALQRRVGYAWVALTLALALHVADEAGNDFLSVYNPTVARLRERLGFFPMPQFEFGEWLAGLIVAIVLLSAVSVSVFSGARWTRPLAYFFAGFMLLNGLGHFAGSLYLGRAMPGVYSSPFLLLASLYLFRALAQSKET